MPNELNLLLESVVAVPLLIVLAYVLVRAAAKAWFITRDEHNKRKGS